MLGRRRRRATVTAKYLKEKLGFYPFDLVRASHAARAAARGAQGRRSLPALDRLAGASTPAAPRSAWSWCCATSPSRRRSTSARRSSSRIVSHELRTPLTSITGALDIVLKQYAQRAHRQAVALPRDGARLVRSKLNSIVDDLLDVAKVERGKLSMRMGALDLAALARDAVERFRAAGEQKNIAARRARARRRRGAHRRRRRSPDAGAQQPAVQRDQVHARRRPHRGRHLRPAASRAATSALSVWNNGVSIAEDDRERVFDKFEQIQSSNTRKVGGTGLGLAISRGIVEAHGGRIWVEGARDDEGTRFVVTLPMHAARAAEGRRERRRPARAVADVAQRAGRRRRSLHHLHLEGHAGRRRLPRLPGARRRRRARRWRARRSPTSSPSTCACRASTGWRWSRSSSTIPTRARCRWSCSRSPTIASAPPPSAPTPILQKPVDAEPLLETHRAPARRARQVAPEDPAGRRRSGHPHDLPRGARGARLPGARGARRRHGAARRRAASAPT